MGKPNLQKSGDGGDLHAAARSGDLIAVQSILISSPLDVNSRDKHSRTPLHLAAFSGQTEVVSYLCKNKADVGASAMDDMAAIHFAAQKGHLEVVRALVSAGASFKSSTRKGVTPLHFAVQGSHLELVKYLSKKGASLTIKTKAGKTPLDLATNDEVRAFLEGFEKSAKNEESKNEDKTEGSDPKENEKSDPKEKQKMATENISNRVGLVISSTHSIRDFLSEASTDTTLSAELRRKCSDLLIQSDVPYEPLRAVWIASDPSTRPELTRLLSGTSFIFSSPKPREKSEELKARLKKLEDLAERKAYQELVKDIAPKEDVTEPFSSYKDQLGFGLHVLVTMFTGYLVGYAAFRALFDHSPAMSLFGREGKPLLILFETVMGFHQISYIIWWVCIDCFMER